MHASNFLIKLQKSSNLMCQGNLFLNLFATHGLRCSAINHLINIKANENCRKEILESKKRTKPDKSVQNWTKLTQKRLLCIEMFTLYVET